MKSILIALAAGLLMSHGNAAATTETGTGSCVLRSNFTEKHWPLAVDTSGNKNAAVKVSAFD